MATRIHAFGPNGELSPGAAAALAGLGGGGGGASALNDLTDVDTTGATTGDSLTYNGSEWVADAPSAGTVTSTSISDSTATGRAVLTAADAATARGAIGAGTSNLVIGTTAGTAAAGNRAASTSAIGMVELATTAEATTGTDTTRAVTPAGVKAVVDARATDYATAAQGAKADSALQVGTPVPIVALSGAQTTGATHAGKDLHITASSGVDLTVQTAPAGSVIQVRQSGAGALTCVGDGVTLTAMPGMTLISAGLGARFAIVYTSTTTADVLGWMVAS